MIVGQRFIDDITSYLEEARGLWPWLLGAAVLGAVCFALLAVVLAKIRRLLSRRGKRSSETQPLISSSEGSIDSYQAMMAWSMLPLDGDSVHEASSTYTNYSVVPC